MSSLLFAEKNVLVAHQLLNVSQTYQYIVPPRQEHSEGAVNVEQHDTAAYPLLLSVTQWETIFYLGRG